MVLSVLTAAAATQDVAQGALLLFVFGLGRTLPLFLAGLSAAFVQRIEAVAPYVPVFEKVFGVLFLGLGSYYLYLAWVFVRLSIAPV